MDSSASATIISAIVSVFVSSLVSNYFHTSKTIKEEEARLNQNILEIIKISIEYPYLEDDSFCRKWDSNKNNDEQWQRYDNYCCIVFNLMEQIFKLYKGDKEKIEYFFATKEMIKRHKLWWHNPSGLFENLDGYDYKFQQYVKSFI